MVMDLHSVLLTVMCGVCSVVYVVEQMFEFNVWMFALKCTMRGLSHKFLFTILRMFVFCTVPSGILLVLRVAFVCDSFQHENIRSICECKYGFSCLGLFSSTGPHVAEHPVGDELLLPLSKETEADGYEMKPHQHEGMKSPQRKGI